jgi:hypothetical protein
MQTSPVPKLGAGVALIDLINELVEHPISMSDDE